MTRHVTRMTLFDAEHIPPARRDEIIASYPEHERAARVYGEPALGTGAIFTVPAERLRCAPFPIPAHWTQINGVDFGWDHPAAAAHCAWDRDDDVWYVVRTYRAKNTPIPMIAAAMRVWGDWVPTSFPHDGLSHDRGSGLQLAEQFRSHGINMLHEHATHEAGGFGVEAGVQDMAERMATGRFKVFEGNEEFFEEYRLYHREDGKIVKEFDDVLCAVRYSMMMKRFAKEAPKSGPRSRPRGSGTYSFMG